MFYRVMPKCTLNGRGVPVGVCLLVVLGIASLQRCWDAPTENVRVRGWRHPAIPAPDFPLTVEQHSAQHIHAAQQP